MVFVTPSYGTEALLEHREQTCDRTAGKPERDRHDQHSPPAQRPPWLLDFHLFLDQRLDPRCQSKIIA